MLKTQPLCEQTLDIIILAIQQVQNQMQIQTYFDPETVPSQYKVPALSDLPSDLYYLFIVNQTSHLLKKKPQYPYVLTYRNTNSTLGSFMEKYIISTFGKMEETMEYYFVLGDDKKLVHDMTVNDLLKMLGRTRTDGIFLFARNFVKKEEDGQYLNESAFVHYVQKSYYSKESVGFEIRFMTRYEDSIIEEISYVPCKFSENAGKVQQLYLDNFSKEFAIPGLNKDSIAEMYFYNAIGQKTAIDFNTTFDQQKVYKTTTIYVVLKNPNKLVLKRAVLEKHDCEIIVYKENEAEPIRVGYDEISHLTFQDFYKSRLEKADSKNKRDAIYCLKVVDIVIKPNQRMNIIENMLIGKEIKLVAHVVNEKMLFYCTIPKLTQPGKDFKIDDIQIPQNQKNVREKCRNQSIKRSAKAKNQHFKNSENIEPIMIYTAELMYLEGNTPQIIYVSLNKYLRQKTFLDIDEKALESYKKQWRLKYASSLLRHLQIANSEKKEAEMVAWRGISYDPKIQKEDIGKIITFKQFVSTSVLQSVAVEFAITQSAFVGLNQPLHLLRLVVKTGTPIIEYSIFDGQAEILLNPYSEFQVKAVKTQTIHDTKFNVYQLEEVITSKDLPQDKENLIIWIDDKLEEGKEIYESIKMPKATTVMHQIASTIQLEAWLKKNRHLFDESTTNLVFITNMTRKQGENWNGLAGIQGLKKIRAVNATVPVFFYIGDYEAAKKKVDESKLDQKNIRISNMLSEIKDYLRQVLNLNDL